MLHWLSAAGGSESFHLNLSQNVSILLTPMWFWGMSNKYFHCGVPVQLVEIHLHVQHEALEAFVRCESVRFLDLS